MRDGRLQLRLELFWFGATSKFLECGLGSRRCGRDAPTTAAETAALWFGDAGGLGYD
jgi:hypothetical protein